MTRCPRCGARLINAARLLARARKRAKLTQAEAARLLGMLPQNLNAYEAGTRSPRADNLRAMLKTLGRVTPPTRTQCTR